MEKTMVSEAAPWVVFAFLVATVIVGLLFRFVVWYARQQLAKIDVYADRLTSVNQRLDARDRADDLLERRLEAGAESMREIKQQLETTRTMVIDLTSNYTRVAEYERYRHDHDERHREIDGRLTAIEAATNKLVGRIEAIGDRVESSLADFRGVLAKYVHVPREAADDETG
jgi:methyl-accepting chemotaxis protein